ncbi:hypothetical protein [Bythopirellula goksoeyrii]|uniref:Uncharacterized protein n=1 Tax=Bythopirellula goksoeyrii TaxID=1400387 RepID=A0A5B9QJM2_9BACT|nr:hypothetical protein [Bythopirellula goksoeyrii]QEG37780.1 hypothetical protein Pr1d_51270 [Bythopirellula goksoeyrii]
MLKSRYFILRHEFGNVVAIEAPTSITEKLPPSVSMNGNEYLPLRDGDTFFFWDELCNKSGATVGYTFLLPESDTFANSSFIRNSNNVKLDGSEVIVLLEPCSEPVWECVQGFHSEIYCNSTDKTDCLICMYDWSQNPLAFPLRVLTKQQLK